MLYADETASLTNIDGYFNMRLRPQKSVLTKYLRYEMDKFMEFSKTTDSVEKIQYDEEKLINSYINIHQLRKYENIDRQTIAKNYVINNFQVNFLLNLLLQFLTFNFQKLENGKYISNNHPIIDSGIQGTSMWSYGNEDFEEFINNIG